MTYVRSRNKSQLQILLLFLNILKITELTDHLPADADSSFTHTVYCRVGFNSYALPQLVITGLATSLYPGAVSEIVRNSDQIISILAVNLLNT